MPDKYYDEYENTRRKISDEYDAVLGSFSLSKGAMMIIWTLSAFGRPCTQKEICTDFSHFIRQGMGWPIPCIFYLLWKFNSQISCYLGPSAV